MTLSAMVTIRKS